MGRVSVYYVVCFLEVFCYSLKSLFFEYSAFEDDEGAEDVVVGVAVDLVEMHFLDFLRFVCKRFFLLYTCIF